MAALISFNRYFAICKPYNYRLSPRASALSVLVCSGLSGLASAPLSLMFGLISYPNGYFNCSIPPRHHLKASLYVYILTAIHFLTIIVTLTMYAFVLRRVRELGKVGSNVSTVSATRSLKRCGEIESVLHDGQPRPTEGKLDLPNIPCSSVADTTSIAVTNLDKSYPSRHTSNATIVSIVHVPNLDNSQQAGPSTSDGAVIAPSPRLTTEEARKTFQPGDGRPGPNGHSPTGEATRRHLTIIMLLYLTMWLPNLFVLIFGYKPELRDTNYTAYTVLMIVSSVFLFLITLSSFLSDRIIYASIRIINKAAVLTNAMG
eukprot:XP_011674430.1 PREDICTED: uncharacterized protein LOC105443200 [Strongylocentrotus purpuratus]